MRLEELDTPVLVADLDAVERNIARMQRYCDEHGLALRPHVKTHKLPEIAQLQVDAGARGITCQKLGEAEVFVDAGFDDVLISFPLIGPAKISRLRALTERARVCVAIDSDEGLDAVAGVDVDVLVECDTGGGRTGVQSPEAAAHLAARAERLRGLMTYPMPPGTRAWLGRALDLIGAVETVSVGGTPTARSAHELGIATELRVGTYVYGDRACIANGTAQLEDCALRVLATVVSAPTRDRVILDAGTKALTSDPAAGARGTGSSSSTRKPTCARSMRNTGSLTSLAVSVRRESASRSAWCRTMRAARRTSTTRSSCTAEARWSRPSGSALAAGFASSPIRMVARADSRRRSRARLGGPPRGRP